jgi:gluconolactonase
VKCKWIIVSFAIAVGLLGAARQPERVGSVEKLDPSLDEIVPPSPIIEKIADGFRGTEGPIWVHAGYLLFSDIPNNVIDKWTDDGNVSVFLNKSGYSGPLAPRSDLLGSNGLTLDRQGRLTICEQGNRRISRLEKNGQRTVLADRYEGRRLNSPNDLVYKSNGCLYFTDPPYGLPKQDDDAQKELPFAGVFRLCGGNLEPVYKELTRPNGIVFSPDERHLYVSNSDPSKKGWIIFDVKPDGNLANARVFYDLAREEGLPDGMKVDRKGNIYATGPGGVWIFSENGKHLGTIKLPITPSNCNWGDQDGKSLYITGGTFLYRVRLNISGVRP